MKLSTEASEDLDIINVDLGEGRKAWYLMGHAKWYPQVSGGDGPVDPPKDPDDPDNPDDEDDPDEKKFSQSDLEAHAAREKRQGKRAATRELMEKLGFDTVEKAEAFIKAAKEKSPPKRKPKGKKDGVDDDDEPDDSEVKAREARADRKELEADLRVELMSVGAPKDKVKLREMVRMIDIEAGADEEDIEDAVAEFKERWPQLFDAEDADDRDDDDGAPTPDTTPAATGSKRRRPKKETGMERADRRFEERHPTPST